MDRPLSRRAVLLAGAGFVVATACGGDRKNDDAGVTVTTGPSDPSRTINTIVASSLVVPGPAQRVSFAVLRDQAPIGFDEPVRVSFAPDRGRFGPEMEAIAHRDGIEERPYWTVSAELPAQGIYGLRTTVGDQTSTAALQVKDPALTTVPLPGDRLPPLPTATTADRRGVNPICTKDPICPLHEISLDEALRENRAMAVLISTPRFCRSQVCGPVLDVLLQAAPGFPTVRFLHIEVFTDESAKAFTPILSHYGLEVEPVLFLVDTQGVVRATVDGPFDRGEATELLKALAAV